MSNIAMEVVRAVHASSTVSIGLVIPGTALCKLEGENPKDEKWTLTVPYPGSTAHPGILAAPHADEALDLIYRMCDMLEAQLRTFYPEVRVLVAQGGASIEEFVIVAVVERRLSLRLLTASELAKYDSSVKDKEVHPEVQRVLGTVGISARMTAFVAG